MGLSFQGSPIGFNRIFMERIDVVNDKLSLIQKTDGLTFGTDALLLASYVSGKFDLGCEFGGGTGIISLLLLTRQKLSKAFAIEVQEEYAELIKRNAELNSLSERLSAVCSDIRDYKFDASFDAVYTNPPYMKTNSGKANELSKKNIARHEVMGDIYDFCLCAKRALKFGGSFFAVYRPDRMCDLIDAMRQNSIEPKRITFVFADERSEPSMFLIEGRSGGKGGMQITRPLIIYKDKEHREYSEDMTYIMENGSFPSDFKR